MFNYFQKILIIKIKISKILLGISYSDSTNHSTPTVNKYLNVSKSINEELNLSCIKKLESNTIITDNDVTETICMHGQSQFYLHNLQ